MRLNEEFFSKSVAGVCIENQPLPVFRSFEIDSRKVSNGDIFIALPGLKVNGHQFVKDAVDHGAIGLMIEENERACLKTIDAQKLKKICVIVVPNTQAALIELATAWRAQFSIPIVGITGSFGKTSVKELLAHILDLAGKNYVASYGNQNTAIGASLNILRLKPEHEVAVFELGIQKRGEMKRLVSIVKPTLAVVTSIGHSHMEGLGSLTDISAEKREIFSFFKEHDIGIVNGDQRLLSHVAYHHPIIKFGSKTTNQIQARKIDQDGDTINFVMKIYKEKHPVTIVSHHKGAVDNALAAAACAYRLGIPTSTIIKGVQKPLEIAGRFKPCTMLGDKGMVIDDSYNANPESMKAALVAFERFEARGDKVAVLGDMAELGSNSPFWHRQLGRFLRKVPSLRQVILVGSQVQWTKKTMPVSIDVHHVTTWQEAKKVLDTILKKDSLVLVKGSRSMGLDQLVSAVCEK